MSKIEEHLSKNLMKAVAIITEVEERYREVAFPIVLQALINTTEQTSYNNGSVVTQGMKENSEFRLPQKLSVNEFFRSVEPTSHPERFVCAAYYLLHTGKADKFTTADILDIYGKLRQVRPKNPADIIYKCVKKVHIIDAPNNTEKQKYYVITPDGEKYVEEMMQHGSTNRNI